MRTPLLIAALATTMLVACGHPATLQYDHGNSYREAMALQADRTRASAADSVYELNGTEGIELRARAVEKTTDLETAESELTLDVK